MSLRLGLPSKGRLMEQAVDWFGARGVEVYRDAQSREYRGDVAIDGVELVLLSAGEIPRELEAGRIHLGVTGRDMVRERLARWDQVVQEVAPLDFGHADLIIAVPDFWSDCRTIHDLDAVATDFRARHGYRLRIATKYHRLVREFLREREVSDYQLVDSQGATEGVVKNETAEAIADITTTGATLRANGLRILDDGLVLKSEAILVRGLSDDWSAEAEAGWARLSDRLAL